MSINIVNRPFSTVTSGDYTADRRFEMAQQFYERGEAAAALDLLEQAAELAPDWPPLPFRRGEILMALGRHEEARAAFTGYLQLDPADRMGAAVKCALLENGEPPAAMPSAYVAALFDDYAPHFDTALVENLEYRAPALLVALVEKHRPADGRSAEYILDLGCGTGLSGQAFRHRAARLDGIDLSAGMLAQAAKKKTYDDLLQGDLVARLTDGSLGERRYDLALAADVLVYIGDLAPLAAAVRAVLGPGGLFAFSVQALADDAGRSYALGADHRYAHSAAYLDSVLEQTGLRTLARETHVLRKDGGQDITGFVVLAAVRGDQPGGKGS